MRKHLSNAAYGVLDYVAYPVGMLLVAPVVLHKLGAAEYGIWTIATAAVSTGGIIASGFGDAHIQHVAKLRGAGNESGVERTVRSMMAINVTLGLALGLAGWLLSPYAARHIAGPGMQQPICLAALRIASALMLVRAVESVSISTQRAYERYGAAVRISLAARTVALAIAAVLAYERQDSAKIMAATAVLLVLGTLAQLVLLRQFLGGVSLWPKFDPVTTRALFGFGVFSWLQAVAGVVFGQIDRLFLGISLGAVAVASYALCVQLAQPIFGVAAAGLHFLFPYLSGRAGKFTTTELKRTVLLAFACNFLLVAAGSGLLLAFGERLLRAWGGDAIAQNAAPVLPLVVLGSALLGLSVTGNYAMLALGRVRTVAWLSLLGGGTMLMMMPLLLHRHGAQGMATARLSYGLFSLLAYLPLLSGLSNKRTARAQSPATALHDLQGSSRP